MIDSARRQRFLVRFDLNLGENIYWYFSFLNFECKTIQLHLYNFIDKNHIISNVEEYVIPVKTRGQPRYSLQLLPLFTNRNTSAIFGKHGNGRFVTISF